MKRLIPFLLIIIAYFVLAQVKTLPRGEKEELSQQLAQATSDATSLDTTLQSPSEKSFLDDIISKEPVVTEPQVKTDTTIKREEKIEGEKTEKEISNEPEPRVEETTSTKDVLSTTELDKIDLSKIQQRPDIPLFSHRQHIEDMSIECVQCHQTLFSESIRGIKVGPSMKEICSQCHNGKDAPAEHIAGFSDEKSYVKIHMPLFSHAKHIEYTEKCNICHRDIYGELRKIKIPPPMSICSECHNNRKANGSCKVCHENTSKLKPKSHTKKWVFRYGHGTEAKYNSKKCDQCHSEKECYLCHRGYTSFKVHKAAYKYSHGMDAKQRVVNCAHCHDLNNSCVKCHTGKRR